MAFLYKFDGVVAEAYANLPKLVRMAIRYVPRFRIATIDTILQKSEKPLEPVPDR